jgi:hypothetical protein
MLAGATYPPILESLAVVTGCVIGTGIAAACISPGEPRGLKVLVEMVAGVALAAFIGMIPVAPIVYFSMWGFTGSHSFRRLCSVLISPWIATIILAIGALSIGIIKALGDLFKTAVGIPLFLALKMWNR